MQPGSIWIQQIDRLWVDPHKESCPSQAAKEKKDEAKIKLIMMKQRTWEMPLLGFQVDQSFVNSLGRFCPLQFVVSTDQGC